MHGCKGKWYMVSRKIFERARKGSPRLGGRAWRGCGERSRKLPCSFTYPGRPGAEL